MRFARSVQSEVPAQTFRWTWLLGIEARVIGKLSVASFTQSVSLAPPTGEAYTPTVIGVDGTVYAINNATLFAVGQAPG